MTDPPESSLVHAAWKEKAHRLNRRIITLTNQGIADAKRIDPLKLELEEAALQQDAWYFQGRLDDPDEYAKPNLEAQLEETKRKIVDVLKQIHGGSDSGSDTTSSRS